MIKIVSKIFYRNIDSDPVDSWDSGRLVPATAEYSTKTTYGDHGRVYERKLTYTARGITSSMRGNVVIRVEFEDGTKQFIGNEERPARLEIEEKDLIKISCTYMDI